MSVARFSQAMLPSRLWKSDSSVSPGWSHPLNADHRVRSPAGDGDRTASASSSMSEAGWGHGLGDRVGAREHVGDLQHAVGQAIDVVRAAIDHDQRTHTGQRVGADLERRSGQQHRIGIGGPLLPGDAAQAASGCGSRTHRCRPARRSLDADHLRSGATLETVMLRLDTSSIT